MPTSTDLTGKTPEVSQTQAHNRIEYLDNYDVKLALIPQVKAVADYLYLDSASFWATLWTLPTSDVQALLDELRQPSKASSLRFELMSFAMNIPIFMRIFRGSHARRPYADVFAAMAASPAPQRNENEALIASQRDDNKCVITDTCDPTVCYVFPLASLEQHHQHAGKLSLYSLTKLWGDDRIIRLMGKLFNTDSGDLTAINTAANMICLDETLREWWNMAVPGGPQGRRWRIRLRFHWLKKAAIHDLTSVVDFSVDPVPMLQEPDEGPPEILNATTRRSVESGQAFTVTAGSPRELPDYDILRLQWDLLRMWRLAGGADPATYTLDVWDTWEPETQATGDDAESWQSSTTLALGRRPA
ncbi:hypothetical protein LX36DRAFT_716134 [Colletotrichum falcatum]|nr:hypothetical protein LX36DRAFT_716134 [Colletotrichum falcatum]